MATLFCSVDTYDSYSFPLQIVEIEIKNDDKSVEEVDVLRGREILQRFSGKYGSICLVVRRPGKSCCSCRD